MDQRPRSPKQPEDESVRAYEERRLYRIVELLAQGEGVTAISERVNTEFGKWLKRPLSRQGVYERVERAFQQNFFRLNPVADPALADRIERRFELPMGTVRVVSTGAASMSQRKPNLIAGEPSHAHRVSAAAAEWVMELAPDVVGALKGRRHIGLGLGPGLSTLEFSRCLAAAMNADATPVRWSLFALTAGGLVDQPQLTPTSFFNLFPPRLIASYYGLYAQTTVRADIYNNKITRLPQVKEVLDRRDDIDLVVTAMGDLRDEHDLLRKHLGAGDGTGSARELPSEWIGNVQYRPFTRRGFVIERDEERAVTLFQLDELCQLRKTPHRHVLLMVRPCGECGNTRAEALLPLMTESMRVFSQLVLDAECALDLLALSGDAEQSR